MHLDTPDHPINGNDSLARAAHDSHPIPSSHGDWVTLEAAKELSRVGVANKPDRVWKFHTQNDSRKSGHRVPGRLKRAEVCGILSPAACFSRICFSWTFDHSVC